MFCKTNNRTIFEFIFLKRVFLIIMQIFKYRIWKWIETRMNNLVRASVIKCSFNLTQKSIRATLLFLESSEVIEVS